MTTYISKDGDTVDAIAFRYYGEGTERATEQILEANPGLAEHGPTLPAGISVTLPAIDKAAKVKGVRLWD